MNDYLDNVREIERRIQQCRRAAGRRASWRCRTRPTGHPVFDYEEHVKMMYDLMALAYQANVTRVFTFMMAREISNRTYPQVGVSDGHHAISHHSNQAAKMDKNVKIQTYHISAVRAIPGEAAGHAGRRRHRCSTTRCLLYGSNMSNSNAHNHFPLPNLVVGGGAGRLKGGRHLKYPDHTPMTNLLLTMLDKAGVADGQPRRQHGKDGGIMRRSYETRRITAVLLVSLSRLMLLSAPRRCPSRSGGEERRQGRGRGAACSRRSTSMPPEADGTTALHWAVRADDLDTRGQVDRGRRQRQSGEPLRRNAALSGLLSTAAPPMIEKLLKAGADANAVSTEGETALMTAARTGNVDAAKVLLAHGAAVDARESWQGRRH